MTSVDLESLLALMRSRRSVRRFRSDPLPPESIATLVEAALAAPTAGNRQAFRLLLVSSPRVRAAMAAEVRAEVAHLRQGLLGATSSTASTYLDNFAHFADAPLVIAPIHRVGPDLLRILRERAALAAERAGRAETPGVGGDIHAGIAAGALASCEGRGDADAIASVSAAIMNVLLCAQAQGLGACWMTGPLVAAAALEKLLEVPRGWRLSALVPVGFAAQVPEPPPRRPPEQMTRFIVE